MKKSDELVTLGPWPKGIDNTHDSSRLPAGTLAGATNADIDDAGAVSRRGGFTTVYNPAVHSIWSDGDQLCFFVENGNLKQLLTDYSAVLIAENVGNNPMSYVKVRDKVYCTNGTTIFYVENGVANGLPNPTRVNKYPLPAGQLIEHFMNRNYVASGNTLWYSDAVFHMRVDKRKNFKQFRSKIIMLRAVSGGLFLSDSDKTYYLSGDTPERMQLVTVFNYPAIAGTDVIINGEDYGEGGITGGIIGKLVIWSSKHGICLGLPGGQAYNVTQNRYTMTQGSKGAGLYRETTKGTKQYLSVIQT